MQPFIFMTDDGAPPRVVLELAGADLPRELPEAWTTRTTVTRYAGENVTVQVHGRELRPIELEGTIDDSWYGQVGHADSQRGLIRQLANGSRLVRLEYGREQWWGTFDAEVTRKKTGLIEYRITYTPYWDKRPTQIPLVNDPVPPPELATALLDVNAEQIARMAAPPADLDASWAQGLYLDALAVQGALNGAATALSTVTRAGDMTVDLARRTSRSLFGAVDAMRASVERTAQAPILTLASSPVGVLLGYEHNHLARTYARRVQADSLARMREVNGLAQPARASQHVVRQGDTLPRLAVLYLGAFDRWPEIAEANDLDTSTLSVGQTLSIPPR